ncbi:TPA_asm: phage tail tape measure protein [Salmonella enterica subsp. enterica]|uniref:Phage tail tape measure protein n=1 Tax=Salmonella enterica subsp. enterica serovar Orion TaxID=399586 RepID=A0A6X8WFT8_SALET|nr:phage tail tape measure protein [Salmonella enterica subsp. enterica serovar Orion]HAB2305258.1 phage tail tape measure protein [Salmonella enterica subsp. enterica serovar Orion]HAB4659444.1 phage tail tape measure protein [Salmonella enterica subsp. enterica serovar Orion]HAE1366130.1 phage tail tape measure protein [Salmonella enterica subsp. enterica serovar Orion]HAO8125705.1 phage tail tape measure protein [Salmonella enterica subsp. enterica serovar Orion]
MSDNNLRLQVILNAVDKLTRPFRSAQASSKELATALQTTRNSLKELNKQAGRIDEFRKTRSQLAITATNLSAAREEAAKLAMQFAATNRPTAAQAKLFSQAKNRVQELQQTYNGLLGSVQRQRQALKESGIDTKQLSSAQRELRKNADETRQALERQQKSLKRLGEQQAKMNAAREQYSRRLEVRDRIAGAGATTTAAGLAMGAPVMAAVKSYASMEDAMKGVAKQVNGLRDDNGNRTKQFYDMQDAIKAASEQLPMENGAIDYAALVEGGARMGVTNQDDPYEDQKRDLLAFASTAAKAATAFELPADELAEGLGKIASLYKVPTRNIEQLGDALNYLDDNAMSKGADIIDVLQRMGGVADRLDFRKAAALGSTFLSLGAAPEIAASASNAMVRELSIATMQSKRFFEGMDLLKLNPAEIEKQMTTDAMGTIQRVLEKVNKLPKDKRLSAMTMVFGEEFGDDAAKLANNLPELQRQLKLTSGNEANGSMQKESDINKDSLSAQWLLVKTGAQNAFSSLGETLRQPLMDIMDSVKRVTGALRRWVEANPQLAGTLMKVAAATAAITVALGTLAVAVAAVLGPLAVIRFGMSVLGVKTLPSVTAAVTRTGSALSWLAGAPLSLLRRGIASSGGSAGLLSAPLNSLRRSAGLAGNALKAVAGAPLAMLRAGMSGIRNVIGMVMNPLAALRGGLSAAGGVLRFLVSGPLALLRVALYGISGLLGALLSPIGLVVAALAGVALVIWKYWQPISAFLGGVVEGFKAAAAPISAAFEPLRPVFQWIGDKVRALWGWFTDLLTPVKSTSEELNSAAAMGRRFGEALAEGLNMVMHPLESLKSGVSWLLEKLGIVSKEAAKAKLPEQVTRQQPATVNSDGKVVLPPGGFPSMGFAGMYDNGGTIPRGQFGIVGENGPEIVNGPANVTSRRRTAALASVVAGVMGVAAAPAEAAPLHPYSLPAVAYKQSQPAKSASVPPVMHFETHAPITIYAQPGQSAQDIAREVARQLDERERKTRAKARSNFSDQGGYES